MAIAGPERRLELGKKLHSSLDILQTPTYSRFLKTFFPVFAQLLQQLPIQQQPDRPDHKLRWLIVDVLQRLPQNETIKPYVNDLLRLALRVISSDNEENALKCMHIFSDVLRTHKPQDPDAAIMFLDFVKGVYNKFASDSDIICAVITEYVCHPCQSHACLLDRSAVIQSHYAVCGFMYRYKIITMIMYMHSQLHSMHDHVQCMQPQTYTYAMLWAAAVSGVWRNLQALV